jgi:hypothetical protein
MRAELMFQVLNKVTGGKPCATRRSSGGRQVILKALGMYIYVFFKFSKLKAKNNDVLSEFISRGF